MMESLLTARDRPTLPAAISSSEAKLVYLYLEVTDGATATELSESLSMQKLSTLSVLQSLSGSGLVERTGNEYVTLH